MALHDGMVYASTIAEEFGDYLISAQLSNGELSHDDARAVEYRRGPRWVRAGGAVGRPFLIDAM